MESTQNVHPKPRLDANLKPRIVLLNPPGDEIYIRDYYCSKVSKTTYVYTPVDLLMMSARLTPVAELVVIDAIGERLSIAETLERVRAFQADAVVLLTAAVSWDVDLIFIKKLREIFKGKILASGDIVMNAPTRFLALVPEIDAVVTDFTSADVAAFCVGTPGPFQDVVYQGAGGVVDSIKREQGEQGRSYDIPIPRHDLFPLDRYRYPFVRRQPFATVLTDFGCAFKCSFCIQSYLDFKARSAENVVEELRYLRARGVRDIYFSDQTFAYNPTRAKKIFQAMIDERMNFGWVAFYRVDLVREEMLQLMKRAGCHTLMFGIESSSEKLLKEYDKNIKIATIRSSLALCRKYGIRTVGTFILGFPNETKADIESTIAFSLDLPLDYASYNLPVPRSLTQLRKEAVAGHIVGQSADIDLMKMDQSGKHTTMGNKYVSSEELYSLRNLAIKRFYTRPSYILRRLCGIRSFYELKINFLDGFTLLREAFRKFDRNGH